MNVQSLKYKFQKSYKFLKDQSVGQLLKLIEQFSLFLISFNFQRTFKLEKNPI